MPPLRPPLTPHPLPWNFFKFNFPSLPPSLPPSVGAQSEHWQSCCDGEKITPAAAVRPRLPPLRRVVLIAHFKVGCGGERVSHASARTRVVQLASSLTPSRCSARHGRRESGRAGQARVGRTILRSAEFFFLHSLPPALPSSLAQSFLWHRITSGTCACVVAPAAAVLLLLRSFSPSLPPSVCVCLQCSLLLPRISPVTSLPFFAFRCSSLTQSMTKSTAHEISPTHLRMPLSLLSVP